MIKACKKCRREGEKLLIKGERCLSAKCAMVKRPYIPGDHGQGFHGKMSEYGKQLREKQKARRIYNIGERQFKSYVTKANTMLGNKTENLMRLFEVRIDNVIARIGFANSRSDARQMVSHGLFMVNKKRVKTPSYQLKMSDIVEPINPNHFKETSLSTAVTWLEADSKKLTVTVKHLPVREEIDTNINENLIIEFYSR
ncbi:MAG: 30S ribosomal protein S4 [Candidatus Berkelbacteria bacterium]|nr:30S ribosomal protein S4 [Candidatus Berkelbacteria bacterium]